MKKYSKKDCSICVEYPYGCDDCYSEMKTFMTTKNKLLLNKRQHTCLTKIQGGSKISSLRRQESGSVNP